MVESQNRDEGSEWVERDWRSITLSEIRLKRFRFHGKLVEERHYLNAYMEKEIITDRLFGRRLWVRISNGDYKR